MQQIFTRKLLSCNARRIFTSVAACVGAFPHFSSMSCHLCHFAVDVRWRQTYLHMSLMQECHQATCLAHLRTRLNKRGRKSLNAHPLFVTEFSNQQAALARSCVCSRWCTKNQPPSLRSHICSQDISPRALDVCSKAR